MVGRFSRGVLPSSRCYSVYEVQQAIDAHWSVFPLEWFHLLRKVLWFYPLYVFSIVLSTIWYNDIARYGYAAMGRSKFTVEKGSSQNNSPTVQNAHHVKGPSGLGGVMIGIGQQVYSILLLSVFFLEVYATGFIPYIGKLLNFLLLSWMYAYYCFEYKWNFNEVALDRRLDYFESYWPFFAGFVCSNCNWVRVRARNIL
uniref:Uncharacterized protein n=1 Tax=Glycine max TaxID=3847 RepID=A0A0R0HG88_SOYBN